MPMSYCEDDNEEKKADRECEGHPIGEINDAVQNRLPREHPIRSLQRSLD